MQQQADVPLAGSVAFPFRRASNVRNPLRGTKDRTNALRLRHFESASTVFLQDAVFTPLPEVRR